MWFSGELVLLTVMQAACIALAAAGLPPWLERFRGAGWALVLPLSIAVVIGAIAVIPSTADLLTWVALILVPVGCALALGWAMRGARPWLALLAGPLLALAWALPDDRLGQLAAVVLIAGSAITAGRLLAGAAPLTLLKVGVVLMAIVDSALVFSGNLQHPNDVLVAAAPGGGLPQLQSASYAGAGMGYGDFFAAAVVGAILAAEHRPRVAFAAVMLGAALCWDQLFLVYDVLPATVPPALALIVAEAWSRRRALRRRPRPELAGA
jgi:prepilin signal peptidase PulO-like enzyme (type II secretory pathway)